MPMGRAARLGKEKGGGGEPSPLPARRSDRRVGSSDPRTHDFVKVRPVAFPPAPAGVKTNLPAASSLTLPTSGGPSAWSRARVPSLNPDWPVRVDFWPLLSTSQANWPSAWSVSEIVRSGAGWAFQVPTRLAGGGGGGGSSCGASAWATPCPGAGWAWPGAAAGGGGAAADWVALARLVAAGCSEPFFSAFTKFAES